MQTQTTGIILAGGKNSRIGVKKAFLNIGGKAIIDNMMDVYRRLFNEIVVVTNTPEDFEYLGVKLIKDVIPEKGAMGGLYSGLLTAANDYCFVAACDMPFIKEELIRHIVGIKDYDVVVPMVNGFYEPLFALYSKKIVPVLQDQLIHGSIKIIDAYSKVNIKEIYEEELRRFDGDLASITNINTREEYDSIITHIK